MPSQRLSQARPRPSQHDLEDLEETLFEAIAGRRETDGGLEEAELKTEPANFLRHVSALAASKSADGLIDPKLVLSWLLTQLGAGAGIIGLLVPVREAGALLPQLFTAGAIHGLARRKWAWAGGAAGQGIAAAGIVLAALTLEGTLAGIAILTLLALLAVSRSVCSVSHKDVLGKTVGKTRRGAATGAASAVGSAAVIVFALILMSGFFDRFVLVITAIALAALAWTLSALIFARMQEEPSPGESGLSARAALAQLSLIREDRQLARFILTRTLLVGTALAPPYLILIATATGETGIDQLGASVLASAVASLLSSWVWGRMSDRSSRRVLIYAGLAGALAMGLTLAIATFGLAGTSWAIPAALFVLMIAHHGVRQGRNTHLVDMAGPDQRAAFTAVANTVVGVVLLVAGGIAAGVAALSVPLVIGVFLVMNLGGAWLARGLDEVQQHDRDT